MVRTSMPSFAMTVVVPMLGTFMTQSLLQVDLITSLSPPLPQDEIDVLITRDLVMPNTESWKLLQEELVCVARHNCWYSTSCAPVHWCCWKSKRSLPVRPIGLT